MEDKTFELLTQMYADFSTQFKDVKEDIKTIKGDVSTLKGNITKIEMKLENNVDKKLGLLLETRGETNKRLDNIDHKLDIISSKVEKHDVEIRVIKGLK